MIRQGDIWWADLGEPNGSASAYRRPVIVVQCDAFNRSRVATVVCVPLTSNLKWKHAPGNVLLAAAETRLPKDSVANVSQILAIDRTQLVRQAGTLSERLLNQVIVGIGIVLGK